MNKTYLMGFLIVILFSACKKNDEIIPPVEELIIEPEPKIENHIAANINGKPFIIYGDNSLNKDTLHDFSFSFGRTITTHLADNNQDTALVISGYISKTQLCVKFPFSKLAQSYDVMRTADSTCVLGGYYSNSSNFAVDTGYVEFKTTFYPNEKISEFKVGELKVTQLDWEKRVVAGEFNFKAYGYYNDWKPKDHTKITPIDSTLTVTKGSFFYQWEEKLNIGPNATLIDTKPGVRITTELFETKGKEIP